MRTYLAAALLSALALQPALSAEAKAPVREGRSAATSAATTPERPAPQRDYWLSKGLNGLVFWKAAD